MVTNGPAGREGAHPQSWCRCAPDRAVDVRRPGWLGWRWLPHRDADAKRRRRRLSERTRMPGHDELGVLSALVWNHPVSQRQPAEERRAGHDGYREPRYG